MNLNPLFHLRRYREQAVQITRLSAKLAGLETQNNTLLQRNKELQAEKQNLLKQLDECHEQAENRLSSNVATNTKREVRNDQSHRTTSSHARRF